MSMNRHDWRRVWDTIVAAVEDNPLAAGFVGGAVVTAALIWLIV